MLVSAAQARSDSTVRRKGLRVAVRGSGHSPCHEPPPPYGSTTVPGWTPKSGRQSTSGRPGGAVGSPAVRRAFLPGRPPARLTAAQSTYRPPTRTRPRTRPAPQAQRHPHPQRGRRCQGPPTVAPLAITQPYAPQMTPARGGTPLGCRGWVRQVPACPTPQAIRRGTWLPIPSRPPRSATPRSLGRQAHP